MTDITDFLMKQAAESDRKADELFERIGVIEKQVEFRFVGPTGDGLRAEYHAASSEASFYRGQASGYRQSTFIVMQYTGTPAHD